jgi:predicted HAD superfamily Cof-like phosphohydrolase
MTTPYEQVLEFHRVFGCAINDTTRTHNTMRAELILEEAAEAAEALLIGDRQMIARELADLVYVAYGAAITLGIALDRAVSEVHRANMSKLDSDGTPVFRPDGKVLKGPNYQAPDMSGCVTP